MRVDWSAARTNVRPQCGNTVDNVSETVFTYPMTNTTHNQPHDVIGHSSICQCGKPDTDPIHDVPQPSPIPDIEHTVTIKTSQANAAAISLAQVLNASNIGDENTWHGGLGTDLCEFCEALVILRAAAGIPAVDCLRP